MAQRHSSATLMTVSRQEGEGVTVVGQVPRLVALGRSLRRQKQAGGVAAYRMQRAYAVLPVRDRAILRMRLLEQRTVADVAVALEMDERVVARAQWQALRRLRAELGDEPRGEEP